MKFLCRGGNSKRLCSGIRPRKLNGEAAKNANKKLMKTKLKIHVLFLVILCAAHFARGQGTAFTYQGQLNENGAPANGSYDLRFTIFDVESGGVQLVEPVTNSAVGFSNGLFTVTLDFGAGVFNGAARWVEIGVRLDDSTDFTTLSPRQPLTASPYSIFAGTSANVAGGSVVTSLNGLKDDVTIAAGNNVTITPNGGTLTIASAGIGGSGIWSLNGASTYYNGGNVGIGTSTPANKLTVVAAGYGMEQTDGTRRMSTYVSASGGWLGTISNDPLSFFINGGGSAMTITTGNKVGIGTTTPGGKLTVLSGNSVFSGYGIEHTDGNVRLTTFIDTAYGGWFGTRSAHALNFFVNDGLPSMAIDISGNVVMTPNGGTGGYGSTFFGTPNGESGMTIKGYGGSPNRADVRFNGSSIKMVAGPGSGPPGSINGIAVTTAGNVGIGTDTPVSKLDVRGTTRTCVLTITGGCDLAEPFPMDANTAAKGSVMIIDDENPGRLKLSDRAYDTRVAGIVSGANGINPGISLQQEGVLEGGQNVALTGRVYVLADATRGTIKPGDLLTTSDTPGHAMKVADSAKAQGAILGKAMSALKDGRGMVLVLVTLQ
jgi:hypothetical protein